jgi:hypothetical protein
MRNGNAICLPQSHSGRVVSSGISSLAGTCPQGLPELSWRAYFSRGVG